MKPHTATIHAGEENELTTSFPTFYAAVLFAANHCMDHPAYVTTPKGQIVCKFKPYKGEHPRITAAAEQARLKIERGGGLVKIDPKESKSKVKKTLKKPAAKPLKKRLPKKGRK